MPTATELKAKAEAKLIELAKEKLEAGKGLSAHEMRALAKWEKEQFVEGGMAFMQACPKGTFLTNTHLRAATVHKVADEYDIPELRGSELKLWIILEKLVRLPGILKGKAGWNRRSTENNSPLANSPSPGILDQMIFENDDAEWQQKCYEEKYYTLRDQRLIRQGELLPAEVIHDAHTKFAAILRDAGHRLGVEYGNDAQALLDQAIDDCTRTIEDVLDGWNASRIAEDELQEDSEEQHEEQSGEGSAEQQATADSVPSFLR